MTSHVMTDLVVLDEATSALDNLTESVVMKNAVEQVKNATVIAIAHRLASIREFDRIDSRIQTINRNCLQKTCG